MIKTRPKDKDEHYDRRNKKSDEAFCFSCGSVIKKSTLICPKCGVSISGNNGLKEKSTAILIGLFLSFLTWLYLYEKNAIKFWVGLSVSVIFLIITKILYYKLTPYWFLALIPVVIIWIYAIIDVAIKDEDYYKTFRG